MGLLADSLEGSAAYRATTASIFLSLGAVAAAIYESYAIRTNRLPTITELVKAGGWPTRIAFVAITTAALVDHFITGLVL
jgi:hypothetical protein